MNTTKSIQTSMREHYYVTMDTEEEASQWMEAIISHPEYSESKFYFFAKVSIFFKKNTNRQHLPPIPLQKPPEKPPPPLPPEVRKSIKLALIFFIVPSKIEELTEETPYFGFPLEKILEREGTVVPLLVQTAIDDLVATGNLRPISDSFI